MQRTEMILLETCTTFKKRHEAMELLRENNAATNATLVTNLYNAMLAKNDVDFGHIPDSKGDVTKFKGYDSMRQTLSLLDELSRKQQVRVEEVAVVTSALDALVAHREYLSKGFQLDKEFIVLQYNYLVLACMHVTSATISAYVDFVKQVNKTDVVLVSPNDSGVSLMLRDLQQFVAFTKTGKYGQSLKQLVEHSRDNFIGADGVSLAFVALGAATLIVPLMRELIFVFYYSRMRVSDLLDQQAKFLEINKQGVQALSASAKEKNAILKRQSAQIDKLRRLSDRIRVDASMSDAKAKSEVVKQNKEFDVDTIRTQMAGRDNTTGFQLL